MNNNIIDVYINFKNNYLLKYGLCFFHKENEKNIRLITNWFSRYIKTYTDYLFYHTLNTLDQVENYDFDSLNKEFEGLKIELLDDYSIYELIDTNDQYQYRRELISKIKDISYFICRLDNIELSAKDDLENKVINFVNSDSKMLEYLDGNFHELLTEIKNTNSKLTKFFKDNNNFYNIEYSQIKDKNFYLVNLTSQIKVLEIKYKKALVERVFNDEKLNHQKAILIIQKLSKEILRKFLYNEKIDKYFIRISDSLFYRNKLLIENLLDNAFLKRYIVLLIPYNTYLTRKKVLINKDYQIACLQDLSHINEAPSKLPEIDKDKNISYLIINDYKESDIEEIEKFQPNNIKEIIVDREV